MKVSLSQRKNNTLDHYNQTSLVFVCFKNWKGTPDNLITKIIQVKM